MNRLVLLAALLLPLPALAQWQQVTVDNQTVDVLLPQNYNPAQSYPLVEFLHQNGMGCCQSALEGEFTADFRAMQAQHPSIVIMPLLNQSNGNGGETINFGGVGQDGGGEQFALDAVAMAERQFSVDKAQVYVTGASMGGQGTDQLMVDHGPNSAQPVYAAGLSMAGTMVNDPAAQAVQQLAAAPIIAVHGSDDTTNLPGWDQQMAGLDPSFHLTTVQGTGHDVWDGPSGYSNMALWNQLFGYAMNGAKPLSMSSTALRAAGSVATSSLGVPAPSSPPVPASTGKPVPSTSSASPSTSSAPSSTGYAAPYAVLPTSTGGDKSVPTTTSTPLPSPAPFTPDPNIPDTIGSSGCGQAETGAGNGQFQVKNGSIVDPSGAPFIAKGANAGPNDDPNAIMAHFPGLNFVRLAVGEWDGSTLGAVQKFVSALTPHRVVVEIEDHPWNGGDTPQPQAYSGGQLAAESAVYAQLAAAFKNDPYVWFGSMNEPQGGDVTAQQVATYNAIRGAGSNAMLMMEAGAGGGNPGSVGAGPLNPAAYANMHNVAWDLHFYGWLDGGSTDQNAMNAAMVGDGNSGVTGTRTIQSADGQIPVIIGEFGPACCDIGSVNGEQVLEAVMNFALTKGLTRGFAGWEFIVEGEDSLTNGGQSLTAWGEKLALAVGSSCAQLAPGLVNAQAPGTSQAPAGSSGLPGSAIAVSAPAAPTAPASPLVDDGSIPELAPADVSQSFQQGAQDATQTISSAASAVDAAARARMQ